jgi:hypothetical protein
MIVHLSFLVFCPRSLVPPMFLRAPHALRQECSADPAPLVSAFLRSRRFRSNADNFSVFYVFLHEKTSLKSTTYTEERADIESRAAVVGIHERKRSGTDPQ